MEEMCGGTLMCLVLGWRRFRALELSGGNAPPLAPIMAMYQRRRQSPNLANARAEASLTGCCEVLERCFLILQRCFAILQRCTVALPQCFVVSQRSPGVLFTCFVADQTFLFILHHCLGGLQRFVAP